ncbi:kinase-like protein [Ceratobasidium sp. AG-I]|nr:kinase-like protein [Ceratobasidium sp. AG-I]
MRLQERALDLTKPTLDDHHASSITACLANTYCTVGRWGDARRLQSALLSHLENTLGETHLDTLSIAHDLALTLSHLGRWEDAEALCKRVCEGRKQTLGEFHQDTMISMQILASSYSGQQRWEEATELHEKVLEMRKGVLGLAHADTLSSMHSLATQHQEKGESTWEAEQSSLRVLELRQQTLGDMHPDTLSSMFTLALAYHRQGKMESAMKLAASALRTQRNKLGRDHAATIQTMESLSSWYSERGRSSDAANLLSEILESRRFVYGDDHPKTFVCMSTLVQAYWRQGLPGRAESLHLELLESRKRVLGEDAPSYLSTLLELATRYLDQCRWREASALYKAALRIKKQEIELDHNDREINEIQRQLKLTLFALSSGVFVITPSVPIQSVVAHFTEKAGLKDYSTRLQEAENAPTEPIARGGFSNIYRVTLQDGSELAVKCLRNTNSQYKQVKQTIRELSTWSELRHKSVAELLGLALFQDQLAMVSTWNKKGNVIQYIEREPVIDRYELCKQVVTAVIYLHKLDVVHGDLKGANILVSDDGTLQLADFGLAVMHDATVQFSKSSNEIGGGTLRWMAPELVFGNEAEDDLTGQTAWSMDDTLTRAKESQDEEEMAPILCKETDIYALGMTMLETLTGKRPFKELEKDTSVILALSKGKRPHRPKRILDQSRRGAPFWDILQKCWSQSPADRPTANEVNRLMSLMGTE